jgi:hypothetical protein
VRWVTRVEYVWRTGWSTVDSMPERLQVRLPQEQLERWEGAARSAGVSLSDYVRAAVEARIDGRGPKAAARAVAIEVLPEIEGMFERYLRGGTPVVTTTPVATGIPSLSSAFDPQCDDAHLHRQGVRCASCGGSF